MIRIGAISIITRCMLLGIAGALALPSAAQAACDGSWNLPSDWLLYQDNGYSIEIVIKNQVGNEYSGEAAAANVDNGKFKPFSATVNKTGLVMTITAAGGVYTGNILDDGRIFGTTTNPNNGDTTAWHGDRPATCIVVKTAPAPPPPPPAPASPLDQAGVLKKPGKGGEILKQTVPPASPAGPIPAGAEYATAVLPPFMLNLAARRSRTPTVMTSACRWAARRSCCRNRQTQSGTSCRQNPSAGSGGKT